MRKTLLLNYGPSQIFKQDDLRKSHSVTYGVEQRDFFDQQRLKAKPCKFSTQHSHLKPMFKLHQSQQVTKVIPANKPTREIAPVCFDWSTSQVGRTMGEINNKFDKNYAKIRRYLEGASSVIDHSRNKTYDQYNSYQSITKTQRINQEFQSSSNVHPSNQSNPKITRSKFQPDWINRGK